jgi:predicted ATPase
MRELPTGTVTFLFTDVEGSTRLLQELGDRYAEVLAEHRRTLRDVFVRHGGVEVDTQGDAFFVAFTKASDALAAAAESRSALAEGPIRVRMGMHTGEPVVTEEGYVGIDVHRAARIAAAGHGGQILVSQSTRDLAGPGGLRDLGEHRLKDLTAPERIYQLGDGDFPPLKSLNQTNLPTQPTPLIGREHELQQIRELLRASRIVTLTGAGGSGKTRLALHAAADAVENYPDGVWFVSLASITDPDIVEPTIAQVIGARDDLAQFLRGKKLLLLLDNLEQLLPTVAPRVASLDAVILATSRERLNVANEQEYPVSTLPLDDAVALFVQRARQLQPGFEPDEHVVEIARRLDGLPLALELAAARVKVLPPAKLAARLEQALPLLTGGAHDMPERQQTLRATIDWSYELLDPNEKRLFAGLAVFPSSFSLEAAEEICGAGIDEIQSLVDKSLLRETAAGRFFFLETIREYAFERLANSAEAENVREKHAAFFAALADRRWVDLQQGRAGSWESAEAERENFRVALEWSLERSDAQVALAFGSGLWPYWLSCGLGREAFSWLERALSIPTAQTGRRADSLAGFGNIAQFQGNLDLARTAFEEALAIFRSLGEQGMVAAALTQLADIVLTQGEGERALALAEESVALRRELGGFNLGRGLVSLAEIAFAEGDVDRARSMYEEGLAVVRRDMPDSPFVPEILEGFAEVLRRAGDEAKALGLFGEAIRTAVGRRDEMIIAQALAGMSVIWGTRGDLERAARLGGAAESLRERSALMESHSRVQPERLEPAWSEGREMTFDEAVEYGLSAVD